MDPDACLLRYLLALETGDDDEAANANEDLFRWLQDGGFAPVWTDALRARFAAACGFKSKTAMTVVRRRLGDRQWMA